MPSTKEAAKLTAGTMTPLQSILMTNDCDSDPTSQLSKNTMRYIRRQALQPVRSADDIGPLLTIQEGSFMITQNRSNKYS
jgi:hypothetical protein